MFYGLSLPRHILELATHVCDVIGHGSNNNAVDMLIETCAAETLLGTARDGTLYVAGAGVAQVDEGTFAWLQDKFAGRSVAKKIKANLNIDLSRVKYNELDYSPLLCLIWCRLRYWVVVEPIPKTIDGRAVYWKQNYNSSAGKGSAEEYLERCASVLPSLEDSNIMKAASIVADMTALATNDDAMRFIALSTDGRETVLSRIKAYASNAENINSPADLQRANVTALQEAGWTLGDYSFDSKRTPFLCEFEALPDHVQIFIKCMYAVLNQLIFS